MTTGFQPPTPSPLEQETTAIVTRGGNSDAALMRVSVEIARQFPRDETAIVQRLGHTLDQYPQFAEKALYSIPYTDRRTNRVVRVEGLSIRAAETLAAAWGSLRCGVRVLGEDEAGIDLEAVVFDMEKNLWELAPGRALKTEKTREGKTIMLDERRLLQARGAAASKVKRNAILAVLPLHLKAFFEAKVREKLAGGDVNQRADAGTMERAVAAFAKDFGVTLLQLQTYLDKPQALWIGADVASLRALFNALTDGETTVAEAFPAEPVLVVAPPFQAGQVVEAVSGRLGSTSQASPAPPPETPPPAATAPRPATRPRTPRPRRAEPVAAPVPAESRAEPLIVPTVVEMPAPQPVPHAPAPVASVSLAEQVAAETDITRLDALLGRTYTDPTLSREAKREALLVITQRRDALQAQQTAQS
jgi:hypothetical protein